MASFSKATDLFNDIEKDRRQQTRAAAANGGLCEVVYRLTRVGRYGMHRLNEVMQVLIAADGPLGTEWLAHLLFWNRFDLARTFNELRDYRNAHRGHRSFGGSSPEERVAGSDRACAI